MARKQFYLIRRKDKLTNRKPTFYCRFRDEGGELLPWQSTGETAKTRAENWALAEMERRKNEAPSDTVTLGGFAAGFFRDSSPWIERQHRKGRKFGNAHAKNRQGHLDRYILPRFGKLALADISKPDIEDWLVGLGLSNATCNHIMYTLRIVLREAKDRKLIADNPLQEPEPLGRTSKPRDVFSIAELRALFRVGRLAEVWFTQEKGVLFLVLASTGIRSGECRALSWRQVLWQDRALLVDRTCMGGTTEIGPISDKKGGSKIVLLPSRTLDELKAWRDESTWHEPEDLIFPGEQRGHPLGSAAIAHALAPEIRRVNVAAEKAKLPTPIQAKGRQLTVHGLSSCKEQFLGGKEMEIFG